MKITTLLLATACLLGLVSPSPLSAAPTAAPATSTTVKALLVIASKSAGKTDPRLAAYEDTLRRVLRFESFRLVGQNSADISIPGTQSLPLGDEQRLEIKTESSETNRRLQVSWFEGQTSHMKTGLVLRPGTPAVLGGPAHGEGEVYAIILTAD
jgi:hypothetical protein